jgi:SAM-dependent methyltransferase
MNRNFHIKKGEKVLDVGCGTLPFPLATHLADISLSDNSQRFNCPIPRTSLPLFECSVEDMPFGNSEFDFVYCAHVLEHVSDPAAACREVMRVGKRGYIECPRSWTEFIFHAEEHRWLVDHEKNCLIFREKLDLEKGDHLGFQYRIFKWLEDPRFRRHWNSPRMRAIRTVQFYWEGNFNFLVIRKHERLSACGSGSKLKRVIGRKTTAQLRQFLRSEHVRLLPRNRRLPSTHIT